MHEVAFFNSPTVTLTVDYSDVEGGEAEVDDYDYDDAILVWGRHNIEANPLFCMFGNRGGGGISGVCPEGGYHISSASPCIDAGDNSVVGSGEVDLDGDPRMLDGDEDGVPIVDMGIDEFVADCNNNGVRDTKDIANGTSEDCNENGVPDECDVGLVSPWSEHPPFSKDCNENGVPDECDIADGSSDDCNGNGIPDECDTDVDWVLTPDCNNDSQSDGIDPSHSP